MFTLISCSCCWTFTFSCSTASRSLRIYSTQNMCKHTLPKVLCTHIINNMQIGFWVTLHNSSAYFSGSCGTFYILLLRAYLWYVDCSCMYILFSEPTCSSLASMEAERDRASCKDKGNGSNDNINNDIISHQHLPNIPMGCFMASRRLSWNDHTASTKPYWSAI